MSEQQAAHVPTADQCVLRYMLEERAAALPERDFVRFWRGPTWTYAETLYRVRSRAAALRAAGVRQGDHVLCWMGNGPDLLATWFAINYLGAVYIPINTAARGRPLEHILDNADAPLMVAERGLIDRLAGLDSGALRRILLVGDPERRVPELPDIELAPLRDGPADAQLELDRTIAPWDTQAIMYTSGTTTGPSKGVLSSYVQLYTMGPDAMMPITASDCCMIAGPIFHCGSTLYVYTMLSRGGTMAMIPEFRTADFWDAIRDTGSTVVLLLGVMANFLLKASPTPLDRQHPLRKTYIVPFGEDAQRFRERFGVELYTVYNMTEIASPLTAGPNPTEPGLAGRPRPCFELRVVDANDIDVPVGAVGELIVRSSRPWAICNGYYKDPEATVKAMRNGWFHTGDAFRVDELGRFFFVDRIKDVIRRRGENISSFELESEICAHPSVQEAVAVAVPAEDSEDEVLAVVTPRPGAQIDPKELLLFLSQRVPHYMVPRYVRIVDELPKTASGKLQKHVLRSEGLQPGTWDREQVNGLRLKRDQFR